MIREINREETKVNVFTNKKHQYNHGKSYAEAEPVLHKPYQCVGAVSTFL